MDMTDRRTRRTSSAATAMLHGVLGPRRHDGRLRQRAVRRLGEQPVERRGDHGVASTPGRHERGGGAARRRPAVRAGGGVGAAAVGGRGRERGAPVRARRRASQGAPGSQKPRPNDISSTWKTITPAQSEAGPCPHRRRSSPSTTSPAASASNHGPGGPCTTSRQVSVTAEGRASACAAHDEVEATKRRRRRRACDGRRSTAGRPEQVIGPRAREGQGRRSSPART